MKLESFLDASTEYRNKTITRIFGGSPKDGCYFLAVMIFSFGMLRDHLCVHFEGIYAFLGSYTPVIGTSRRYLTSPSKSSYPPSTPPSSLLSSSASASSLSSPRRGSSVLLVPSWAITLVS